MPDILDRLRKRIHGANPEDAYLMDDAVEEIIYLRNRFNGRMERIEKKVDAICAVVGVKGSS